VDALRWTMMAPTAACKFGSRCTRQPTCTFSHPPWVAFGNFGDRRCREGFTCTNLKCGFAHPADWAHAQRPTPQAPQEWIACGKLGERKCREGGACENAACGFAHPADWVHLRPKKPPPPPPPIGWVACGKFGERKCREGGACENAACGFAHPADWVHLRPKKPPPPPPPIGWVACGKFGERRCREGGACRNATCGFAHPADWLHFHGTMLTEENRAAVHDAARRDIGEPPAVEGLPTDEELEWMAACIEEQEAVAFVADQQQQHQHQHQQQQQLWSVDAPGGGGDGGGDVAAPAAVDAADAVDASSEIELRQLESSQVKAEGDLGELEAPMERLQLQHTATQPAEHSCAADAAESALGAGGGSWPPAFIATAFTTRAAYEAWIRAGAHEAALPAAPS
jgi:hypothetical protein